MTKFEVDMSDEAAGGLRRLAAAKGIDPDAYAAAFIEAAMPRELFMSGVQACIDEAGEEFIRRFGPARAESQAA